MMKRKVPVEIIELLNPYVANLDVVVSQTLPTLQNDKEHCVEWEAKVME